jgi:hypothetical protein
VTEEELVAPLEELADAGNGEQIDSALMDDDDSSDEECEFVDDECAEEDNAAQEYSDEECEFDE